MDFLVDYTTYMRQLAVKHRKLKHTSKNPHFFRGELQEFFDRLRSDVNFPCLIAESSEVSYHGDIHNPSKIRTASFIVADRYELQDDYLNIQLQMSSCEKIAEQILGRMANDKSAPFKRIDFPQTEGQYIQNEQERYVGFRITFTSTDPICLVDKNAWDDGETDI